MRRTLRALSLSLIAGLGLGAAVGALHVAAERYVQQDLHRLALRVLAGSAWSYAGVALASGLAALAIRRIGSFVARRGWTRARPLSALAAWLAASLPLWGWLVLRDRDLLPLDRDGLLAALGALALVHALAFAAWRRTRRDARRREPGRALPLAAGLAAAAATLLAVAPRLAPPAWGGGDPPPNVLLVVMDTVRADRLSSYGNPRNLTPELRAFARESIRFEHFYSTASWTVPSHTSLFTGLYPLRHGATSERMHLDDRYATLAEILSDAGYQTFGASANPYVGNRINLSQGFETFLELWRDDPYYVSPRPADVPHPVSAAFARFLAESDPERPFFAFLNYVDAHLPFSPREPYLSRYQPRGVQPGEALRLGQISWTRSYVEQSLTRRDLAVLANLYDAEVALLSSEIGRLLDAFRDDPRFEDTLIAVTSDHGEHLGEHGLVGHLFGLYNTTVRIPLLLRPPGGVPGGRVERRPAQLVDLFATVLGAAGIEVPASRNQGTDLLSIEARAPRAAVFSEYSYPALVLYRFTPEEMGPQTRRLDRFKRRLKALQVDGYRLIWSSNGDHELYDLSSDRGERHNLYDPANPSPLARELLARLRATVKELGGDPDELRSPEEPDDVPRAPLDDESREALRALGYGR